MIFGLYTALTLKRRTSMACLLSASPSAGGAAGLIPPLVWELFTRPVMEFNTANLPTPFYVAVFPSALAYLCFNRGVQLIGANRAAPFFHVVPVFGATMSIAFLGEHPRLPFDRLCAGADRRFRRLAQALSRRLTRGTR